MMLGLALGLLAAALASLSRPELAGVTTTLEVRGEENQMPVPMATCLYHGTHELYARCVWIRLRQDK